MVTLQHPCYLTENDFNAYIDEFINAYEEIVPYSLKRQPEQNYLSFVKGLQNEAKGINLPENWVPASTYWLCDDRGTMIGATNIRHCLTDSLKIEGGHIGYSIRPKERRKGYGTKILSLALHKLKKLGVTKALLTCDRNNQASASVITKNGGILDSEIPQNTITIQRYWIVL